MKNNLAETKNILEKLPEEKIKIARLFVEWLGEENLSEKELKAILAGEKEIEQGKCVPWRSIARTI